MFLDTYIQAINMAQMQDPMSGRSVTVTYAPNEEPLVLNAATTSFTIGQFFKRGGRVYHEIKNATFGNNYSVIAKEVKLNNRTGGVVNDVLVDNDRLKTEALHHHPNIARIFHCDVKQLKMHLIVEQYKMNLSEYVKVASAYYKLYDPISVVRQLVQTLKFLRTSLVFHRDLRLKNMFIQAISGESIFALISIRF